MAFLSGRVKIEEKGGKDLRCLDAPHRCEKGSGCAIASSICKTFSRDTLGVEKKKEKTTPSKMRLKGQGGGTICLERKKRCRFIVAPQAATGKEVRENADTPTGSSRMHDPVRLGTKPSRSEGRRKISIKTRRLLAPAASESAKQPPSPMRPWKKKRGPAPRRRSAFPRGVKSITPESDAPI